MSNTRPSAMIISTQTPISSSNQNIVVAGSSGRNLQAVTQGGLVSMHRLDDFGNVVLKGNDQTIINNNLRSDGWLIITGHGDEGTLDVGGAYINASEKIQLDVAYKAIHYVDEAMKSNGLKSGDSINVLLYVCCAAEGKGSVPSFAEQVAAEFAQRGINSKIVASKDTVGRIGDNDYTKDDIPGEQFRLRTTNENIRVFETDAKTGKTTISSPNEDFYITNSGIGFKTELRIAKSLNDLLLPADQKYFIENINRLESEQILILNKSDQDFIVRQSSTIKDKIALDIKLKNNGIVHYLSELKNGKYFSEDDGIEIGPAKSIKDLSLLISQHEAINTVKAQFAGVKNVEFIQDKIMIRSEAEAILNQRYKTNPNDNSILVRKNETNDTVISYKTTDGIKHVKLTWDTQAGAYFNTEDYKKRSLDDCIKEVIKINQNNLQQRVSPTQPHVSEAQNFILQQEQLKESPVLTTARVFHAAGIHNADVQNALATNKTIDENVVILRRFLKSALPNESTYPAIDQIINNYQILLQTAHDNKQLKLEMGSALYSEIKNLKGEDVNKIQVTLDSMIASSKNERVISCLAGIKKDIASSYNAHQFKQLQAVHEQFSKLIGKVDLFKLNDNSAHNSDKYTAIKELQNVIKQIGDDLKNQNPSKFKTTGDIKNAYFSALNNVVEKADRSTTFGKSDTAKAAAKIIEAMGGEVETNKYKSEPARLKK